MKMDLLSQHEAFLRAIFDAPEDDTPRLVYADFLQENGEEDRAEFIRLGCEGARLAEDHPRRIDLQADMNAIVRKYTMHAADARWPWERSSVRGFPEPFGPIHLHGYSLEDVQSLRWSVVRRSPEWYGCKSAKFMQPSRLGSEQIDVFLSLPFTQQVTAWDLSGEVREVGGGVSGEAETFALIDVIQQPTITNAGVETLARHRGARRITALDLRNNNLDNDAARALVKSPYLDNLKRLDLYEGNRFRGKVWQQVLERFGEDVVG